MVSRCSAWTTMIPVVLFLILVPVSVHADGFYDVLELVTSTSSGLFQLQEEARANSLDRSLSNDEVKYKSRELGSAAGDHLGKIVDLESAISASLADDSLSPEKRQGWSLLHSAVINTKRMHHGVVMLVNYSHRFHNDPNRRLVEATDEERQRWLLDSRVFLDASEKVALFHELASLYSFLAAATYEGRL